MISIKSNPRYIKKIQKWNSILESITDSNEKKEFKKNIDRVAELTDLLDKNTMKLANSDRNIVFGNIVDIRNDLQKTIKWIETKCFQLEETRRSR